MGPPTPTTRFRRLGRGWTAGRPGACCPATPPRPRAEPTALRAAAARQARRPAAGTPGSAGARGPAGPGTRQSLFPGPAASRGPYGWTKTGVLTAMNTLCAAPAAVTVELIQIPYVLWVITLPVIVMLSGATALTRTPVVSRSNGAESRSPLTL